MPTVLSSPPHKVVLPKRGIQGVLYSPLVLYMHFDDGRMGAALGRFFTFLMHFVMLFIFDYLV
jgi:hypothetical protein